MHSVMIAKLRSRYFSEWQRQGIPFSALFVWSNAVSNIYNVSVALLGLGWHSWIKNIVHVAGDIVYTNICFLLTVNHLSQKLPQTVLVTCSTLLTSVQMMRNTCSRLPSRSMPRRTAGKMLPSMPKAQWLTCSTGWKSRTTWHMSWPMLLAWSPTGTALLTPTCPPAVWTHHQASCLA